MEKFEEYRPAPYHSPEIGGKKPAFWVNTYAYCEARVCPEVDWEKETAMDHEKQSKLLKDIAKEIKQGLNAYASERYGAEGTLFNVYSDDATIRVQRPGVAFTEEDWQHITGTIDTINELLNES